MDFSKKSLIYYNSFPLTMIKGIILVEPKHHVNVGSIARSMACFGFDRLIIVNPAKRMRLDKAAHISEQGKDIIMNSELKENLSQIEGAKIATISEHDNLNHGMKLVPIDEYCWNVEEYLVMGREACGLNDEELAQCHVCLTIPTNGKKGILNLAQAATIAMYEASKNKRKSWREKWE